jgi:hypothetical protein
MTQKGFHLLLIASLTLVWLAMVIQEFAKAMQVTPQWFNLIFVAWASFSIGALIARSK